MDQRGGRALGAVLGGRGGTGDGIRLRPPGPRQHPARTRRRAEQRVGQPVGRGYAPDTREPGIKSRRGRSPDLRPQLAKPGSKAVRSEEHTSELQSLMRISYAVFCLKKKKTTNRNTTTMIQHIEVTRKQNSIINNTKQQ